MRTEARHPNIITPKIKCDHKHDVHGSQRNRIKEIRSVGSPNNEGADRNGVQMPESRDIKTRKKGSVDLPMGT